MSFRVPLHRRPLRRPVEAPAPKIRDHGTPLAPPPGRFNPVSAGLFANPVLSDVRGKDHGDPFVLEHRGTYFLYHTGGEGVHLYTSPDLVHWTNEGLVLKPQPGHWAETDFWAPEVLLESGVFYLYVAATRRKASGKGDDKTRRLGVAKALDPRGPFVWQKEPLLEEWAIDGHPFRDENGELWLFYNIRTEATRYKDGTVGCGNVVGRLLAPDKLDKAQTPVAFPSERWEGNRRGNWYWNEGPFVLRRRGTYYQMYSGGCYKDETYGLGFATAPSPLGPWTKRGKSPILKSSHHIFGPGHHCIVRGPDGVTPYAVYHGYLPGQKGRKVHLDRLYWAGDRMVLEGPTAAAQPRPAGPVYDANIPHYHLSAWASGRVWIGEEVLELRPEGQAVRVTRRGGHLELRLDGVLKYCGAAGEVRFEGQAEHIVRTSWLEDEALHDLGPDGLKCWEWGGNGDLEVSLAVRGEVSVAVGREQIHVADAGCYELVRLRVAGGAERLEVRAGPLGATVTDVVMTARSL